MRARDPETNHEQKAHIQVLGTVSQDQVQGMAQRQDDMPAPIDETMD